MLSVLYCSHKVTPKTLKNPVKLLCGFRKSKSSLRHIASTLNEKRMLIKDAQLAHLNSKQKVLLDFVTEKQNIVLKTLEQKHRIEMEFLGNLNCFEESENDYDHNANEDGCYDGEEVCDEDDEPDVVDGNNQNCQEEVLGNSDSPVKSACVAAENMDDDANLDLENIEEYTPKIAQEIVDLINRYSFQREWDALADAAIHMKYNVHGNNATNLKNVGFGRAVLNTLENEEFWNYYDCVYMIELITHSHSVSQDMLTNSPPSLLQDMFDEIGKQDYNGILYKMMLKSLQGGTEVCERNICPLISMISQHSVASKNKMIESGIVDLLVKRREKKRSEGWGDRDIGRYYEQVFKNLGI